MLKPWRSQGSLLQGSTVNTCWAIFSWAGFSWAGFAWASFVLAIFVLVGFAGASFAWVMLSFDFGRAFGLGVGLLLDFVDTPYFSVGGAGGDCAAPPSHAVRTILSKFLRRTLTVVAGMAGKKRTGKLGDMPSLPDRGE